MPQILSQPTNTYIELQAASLDIWDKKRYDVPSFQALIQYNYVFPGYVLCGNIQCSGS